MTLDFREIGFTDEAIAFPLSAGAASLIAEHNGVPLALLPSEAWFAPNAYMRDWFETLAVRRAVGLPVKEGRRWLTPAEFA